MIHLLSSPKKAIWRNLEIAKWPWWRPALKSNGVRESVNQISARQIQIRYMRFFKKCSDHEGVT